MASFVYNSLLGQLFSAGVNFPADTIKVALLSSSYPAGETQRDTHDFFNDVSAFEVSGTGYTAGGKTLTSVVVSVDPTNNRASVDADDVTWTTSTMTFRYAVIYKSTGTPSTSPLVKMIDLGAEQNTSGTDYTITWSAAGFLNSQEA
jgi:hypothetical protein